MIRAFKRGKDGRASTNESIRRDSVDAPTNETIATKEGTQSTRSSSIRSDSSTNSVQKGDADACINSADEKPQSSDESTLDNHRQRRQRANSSDSNDLSTHSRASSICSDDGGSMKNGSRSISPRRRRNKSTTASVNAAPNGGDEDCLVQQGEAGHWIQDPKGPSGSWIRNPKRQLSLRNLTSSASVSRERLQAKSRQASQRSLVQTSSSDQLLFSSKRKPRDASPRRHKSLGASNSFEQARQTFDKQFNNEPTPPSITATDTSKRTKAFRRNSFGSGKRFELGLKQMSLRVMPTSRQESERKLGVSEQTNPDRQQWGKRKARRKLNEADNKDEEEVSTKDPQETHLNAFAESMNLSFSASDLLEGDVKETVANDKSESYLQFTLSPVKQSENDAPPPKNRPQSPSKSPSKSKSKRRSSSGTSPSRRSSLSKFMDSSNNENGKDLEAGVTEEDGDDQSQSYLQFNLSPTRKRDRTPSRRIKESHSRSREERSPVYPGSPRNTDDKTISSVRSTRSFRSTDDNTVRSEETNMSTRSKSPNKNRSKSPNKNRSKSPRRKQISPTATSKKTAVNNSPRSVDTDLSGRSNATSPRRRRNESPLKRTDSPMKRAGSPQKQKRPDSPSKRSKAPLKRSDSPQKRAESPSKRSEPQSKRPESPSKRPESPSKRPESPSKRPESPSKRPNSPSKPRSGSLRRSAAERLAGMLSPTRSPLRFGRKSEHVSLDDGDDYEEDLGVSPSKRRSSLAADLTKHVGAPNLD